MLLDMFPSTIREELRALEEKHGVESMSRVQRYLADDPTARAGRSRHQLGRHILPGLTARPWHDVSDHAALRDAARALEERHAEILKELLPRWTVVDSLVDYGHDARRKGWKALYLYEHGEKVPDNVQHFPETMKCVQDHLLPHLFELAEVHFSILEPGAHIAPHCDQHNFTLSFHLALVIPEGCGIRVAEEDRTWHEGKCLLFDHSFVHEAWNRSTERRAVLIMDVWNPETTAVERKALGLVFKWLFEQFR